MIDAMESYINAATDGQVQQMNEAIHEKDIVSHLAGQMENKLYPILFAEGGAFKTLKEIDLIYFQLKFGL